MVIGYKLLVPIRIEYGLVEIRRRINGYNKNYMDEELRTVNIINKYGKQYFDINYEPIVKYEQVEYDDVSPSLISYFKLHPPFPKNIGVYKRREVYKTISDRHRDTNDNIIICSHGMVMSSIVCNKPIDCYTFNTKFWDLIFNSL